MFVHGNGQQDKPNGVSNQAAPSEQRSHGYEFAPFPSLRVALAYTLWRRNPERRWYDLAALALECWYKRFRAGAVTVLLWAQEIVLSGFPGEREPWIRQATGEGLDRYHSFREPTLDKALGLIRRVGQKMKGSKRGQRIREAHREIILFETYYRLQRDMGKEAALTEVAAELRKSLKYVRNLFNEPDPRHTILKHLRIGLRAAPGDPLWEDFDREVRLPEHRNESSIFVPERIFDIRTGTK
jgi:hypothetical protein